VTALTARAKLIAEYQASIAEQAAIVLVPIEVRLAEYRHRQTPIRLASPVTAQASTHTSKLSRFNGKRFDIATAQQNSVDIKRKARAKVKQVIVALLSVAAYSLRQLAEALQALGYEVSKSSIGNYIKQLRQAGQIPVAA